MFGFPRVVVIKGHANACIIYSDKRLNRLVICTKKCTYMT